VRGSIREHPGLEAELANRGFVARTLVRLGSYQERIQAANLRGAGSARDRRPLWTFGRRYDRKAIQAYAMARAVNTNNGALPGGLSNLPCLALGITGKNFSGSLIVSDHFTSRIKLSHSIRMSSGASHVAFCARWHV
jgi:hypothetical protein